MAAVGGWDGWMDGWRMGEMMEAGGRRALPQRRGKGRCSPLSPEMGKPDVGRGVGWGPRAGMQGGGGGAARPHGFVLSDGGGEGKGRGVQISPATGGSLQCEGKILQRGICVRVGLSVPGSGAASIPSGSCSALGPGAAGGLSLGPDGCRTPGRAQSGAETPTGPTAFIKAAEQQRAASFPAEWLLVAAATKSPLWDGGSPRAERCHPPALPPSPTAPPPRRCA